MDFLIQEIEKSGRVCGLRIGDKYKFLVENVAQKLSSTFCLDCKHNKENNHPYVCIHTYALRVTLKLANTTKTPRAIWQQRTLLNGLTIVTPTVQYVKCSLKDGMVAEKEKPAWGGAGQPKKQMTSRGF